MNFWFCRKNFILFVKLLNKLLPDRLVPWTFFYVFTHTPFYVLIYYILRLKHQPCILLLLPIIFWHLIVTHLKRDVFVMFFFQLFPYVCPFSLPGEWHVISSILRQSYGLLQAGRYYHLKTPSFMRAWDRQHHSLYLDQSVVRYHVNKILAIRTARTYILEKRGYIESQIKMYNDNGISQTCQVKKKNRKMWNNEVSGAVEAKSIKIRRHHQLPTRTINETLD